MEIVLYWTVAITFVLAILANRRLDKLSERIKKLENQKGALLLEDDGE